MLESTKKYGWIIAVGIICPILVNLILSISTPFTVYENGWLGFWGSFLGALFPFLILHITLNHNLKENNKGRNVQSAIIEYQVSKEELMEIQNCILSFYDAMSALELRLIAQTSQRDIPLSLEKLWSIIKKVENSYQSLSLSLVNFTDEEENKYRDFVKHFKEALIFMLLDFVWLIDGETSLDEYERNSSKNGIVELEKLRIWKVIEDKGFNKITDADSIMHEMIDRMECHAMYIKSQEFIAYESNKMRLKLLRVTKGEESELGQ